MFTLIMQAGRHSYTRTCEYREDIPHAIRKLHGQVRREEATGHGNVTPDLAQVAFAFGLAAQGGIEQVGNWSISLRSVGQ